MADETPALADGEPATTDALAAAAWDARNFAEAARLYELLARARPDDPGCAFRFAVCLAETGSLEKSDDLFRRSLTRFGEHHWYGYHWALQLFRRGEFDRCMMVALLLAERFPHIAGSFWLLAQLATRLADPVAAARHCEAWLRLEPQARAARDALGRARLYVRAMAGWSHPPLLPGAPDAASDYEIAYINLDRSVERRRRIEFLLRDCPVPVNRIPAVDGSRLPMASALHLTGGKEGFVQRGTLACALSHVAAWEWMVARGLPHCLILEDDASPMVRMPWRIADLALPEGYEICFVNEAQEPRLADTERDTADAFRAYGLAEAWQSLPLDNTAPRATGYFLSLAGARGLLARCARDGVGRGGRAADIDWQLVAYSIASPADLPAGGVAAAVVRGFRTWLSPDRPLASYALYPCLVTEHAVDYPRVMLNKADVEGHGA
jgi:tetratricopeptide (TPR) repeat protein